MFKVGDKVKVVKKEHCQELVEIGMCGEILSGSVDDWKVFIKDIGCSYWFSDYELELISFTKSDLKDNHIWKREEKPVEILDEVEKKYLSDVIRPFRDKVWYVAKNPYGDAEFITINIIGDNKILLPNFKKGTMYKGMELNKEYSLKELGLMNKEERKTLCKDEFNNCEIVIENKQLQSQLETVNKKLKKIEEYLISYESISTIQGLNDTKENKNLDKNTMVEMTNRYLKVHDKILSIIKGDE